MYEVSSGSLASLYFKEFMLLIRCILLQLIHRPTTALNKIKFMTNINPLHVSAPEYRLQGMFQIKVKQAKHANLGTSSPL